jgi:hypothetical protein
MLLCEVEGNDADEQEEAFQTVGGPRTLLHLRGRPSRIFGLWGCKSLGGGSLLPFAFLRIDEINWIDAALRTLARTAGAGRIQRQHPTPSSLERKKMQLKEGSSTREEITRR